MTTTPPDATPQNPRLQWLVGACVAAAGALVARFAAPHCGEAGPWIRAAGGIVAIAGLWQVARATQAHARARTHAAGNESPT